MENVFIYGDIKSTTTDFYNVLKIVEGLDESKIELKLRDFGYEIGYEDASVYMYIFGNEFNEDDGLVIFECEYKKTIVEAHAFIESLCDCLKSNQIFHYSFEYGKGDGHGNDIGDWVEINTHL